MQKTYGVTVTHTFFVGTLKWLILAYRALSPLLGTNVCCRFTVSCSEYVLQVFQRERFSTALWLSLRRLLSCNPFTA